MNLEIKNNKVVKVVSVDISSSELYEDVVRLRDEADRIELEALKIVALEKQLDVESENMCIPEGIHGE